MQSPFEPPNTNCCVGIRTRIVLAYLIAATILMPIALSIAYRGLVLLNQEMGWIQTRDRIYIVKIGGKSVPLQVAMRDSLLIGAAVGLMGLVLAFRGIANWRWNSTLSRAHAQLREASEKEEVAGR